MENEHVSNKKRRGGCPDSGIVYFLGVVGSAVYFLERAATFGDGVLGILKALVWPGLLAYHLFQFLGM